MNITQDELKFRKSVSDLGTILKFMSGATIPTRSAKANTEIVLSSYFLEMSYQLMVAASTVSGLKTICVSP